MWKKCSSKNCEYCIAGHLAKNENKKRMSQKEIDNFETTFLEQITCDGCNEDFYFDEVDILRITNDYVYFKCFQCNAERVSKGEKINER